MTETGDAVSKIRELCERLEKEAAANDVASALKTVQSMTKLDMSVEILKTTNAAIRIKTVTKQDGASPELKAAVKSLIAKWRDTVVPRPAAAAPATGAGPAAPQVKADATAVDINSMRKRVHEMTITLLSTKVDFITDSESVVRKRVRAELEACNATVPADAQLRDFVRRAVTDYLEEAGGATARKRVKNELQRRM
ncbi:TFIIS N-terminal domain-containing protein [Pycnococcus provasolii]|uniref:TFIIS N-terminal domain-containing protein n=1 Tax=Pycnococcus provasolii TaxID=41880 RepID=A0A7S2F799_9CHLO|mmetsp:Transcript_18/g.32  ORF Transcript_18/g.32 Transcript_18/m.32 type:complete len:196 (+) Transcript_18:292-879(+)